MTDSYRQIANLVAAYAERVDLGDFDDFDGVAKLLEHAAIGSGTVGDAPVIGRRAVRRLYESTTSRYPDGTPCRASCSSRAWTAATTTRSNGNRAHGASRSAGFWSTWSGIPATISSSSCPTDIRPANGVRGPVRP
jgi:hypothetical protein